MTGTIGNEGQRAACAFYGPGCSIGPTDIQQHLTPAERECPINRYVGPAVAGAVGRRYRSLCEIKEIFENNDTAWIRSGGFFRIVPPSPRQVQSQDEQQCRYLFLICT